MTQEGTTHMSQQGFLSQGLHQTLGVHLAEAEDVERPPIFKTEGLERAAR